MPAPSPFPSSQPQQPFPALYLYPINDSFVPKHIALLNNQHVKIGRQTNAKTAPGERNGYFDSKVLSRQHAEVWEEGGKIFIKDVKSSNGTFINGERLSPEGIESEPFELKSDDIVEFGIDIVGEDNKTIIHHKVAARVVCVFNEQDVQVAARAEQLQQQQLQQQHQQYHPQSPHNGLHPGQPGATANGAFNFPGAPQQRRAQLAQQGLTGMGGMGGNIRPPGKSGLSFELIFSRLQGELQKSKDTGVELQNLTSALGDIQETLGGALPQNMPPPPHSLPPVRPPQTQQPVGELTSAGASHGLPDGPAHSPSIPSDTLLEIQSRLQDTQASLASHVDKIRSLENILSEQEALKREMRILRDMMETREREFVLAVADHSRARETEREKERKPSSNFDDDDDDDDDDDARSVATVTNGELGPIDEEDEEHLEHHRTGDISDHDLETEEEKHRRREELGRPKTPEPTIAMHAAATLSSSSSSQRSSSPSDKDQQDSLFAREVSQQVSALSEQVRAVMAVKSVLEAQHLAAQATIQALEKKVESLEAVVKSTQEQQVAPSPSSPVTVAKETDESTESLTEILSEWKKSVQGQWSSVQEEWSHERERLNRAREEFEAKTKQVDAGLQRMACLETSVNAVQEAQTSQSQQLSVLQTIVNRLQIPDSVGSSAWFREHGGMNGDAIKHGLPGLNGGLVTPPSPPRSHSSDSGRHGRSRKRKPNGRKKGKAAQGSVSAEERTGADDWLPSRHASSSRSRSREQRIGADADTDSTLASEESPTSEKKHVAYLLTKHLESVSGTKGEEDEMRMHHHPEKSSATLDPGSMGDRLPMSFGSVSSGPGGDLYVDDEAGMEERIGGDIGGADRKKYDLSPLPYLNAQAAFGVLVLSVAAAAVIWRVKPE